MKNFYRHDEMHKVCNSWLNAYIFKGFFAVEHLMTCKLQKVKTTQVHKLYFSTVVSRLRTARAGVGFSAGSGEFLFSKAA